MIYFELILFVKIVSLFTQNGKLTVTGSIVGSFGVFHRCVAASNQWHYVVYSSSCTSFYKYKNTLFTEITCWVYSKFKINFRHDVCQGQNIFLHPTLHEIPR